MSSEFIEDDEVVKLLKHVLTEARAGRVAGVAIVFSPTQENFGVRLAGANPASLYSGCGLAQKMLLDAMTGRLPQQPASPIIRASALS